jgi:PHD/YefM family antitoxin component YafN of YafNO toxin-antitoxin module
MDINEIKKIIQEDKAKVIIINEQGPSLVILDYTEYLALKSKKEAELNDQPSLLSKYNDLEMSIDQSEQFPASDKEETLRLEDLPF